MTTQRANDLEHLIQQRRQQVHELESELGKLDEQLGNSKSPAESLSMHDDFSRTKFLVKI